MKIAVIGAGAIGSIVAAYLSKKDEEVHLVGRPDSVERIREHGLAVSGVRGDHKIKIQAHDSLVLKPDLAILATKTQDVEEAIKENLVFLKDSLILTTQNGVQAENLIAKYIGKNNIISSIVMFGATYLEPGKVIHNFEGSWIIGSFFENKPDKQLVDLSLILDKAFPTIISEDIKGMKYLKIFVNANNCIPAILGKSMQEVFSDLEVSRISIAIWKEGFEIIEKAKINLVSLPGFPVENVTRLTSLEPLESAKIFSQIMAKLSSEPLYGSILQSIKRNRLSEIDYINGEFIRLAKENNISASLNEKLVEMVHAVEKTRKFFSKEELIKNTKGLLN